MNSAGRSASIAAREPQKRLPALPQAGIIRGAAHLGEAAALPGGSGSSR
jgi:hypothetical protein